MSASVGADVESLCNTCGDVWHVVVAKLGESIIKVQCKQCGRVHRPIPLPGRSSAAAQPRARTGGATPRAAKSASKAASRNAPVAAAPAPRIDPSKPFRPYSPAEAYAAGEQITHATFGAGVVEAVPAPGKMRVVFSSGPHLLVQAKAPHEGPPPPSVRPAVAEDADDE